MTAIINGVILTETGEIHGKTLRFADKIVEICDLPKAGDEIVDAKGLYVAPGLIDVHIHGFLGEDASDGSAEGLRKMAKGLLAHGVTTFLPTTMTVPRTELDTAFHAIREAQKESADPAFDGAEALFCHAEGPFINEKKKGAQAAEAILPPDAKLFAPYKDVIRLVTLAPEMDGALSAIRELRDMGMRVSIGHTMATCEQSKAAIAAGADHYTHLFNAMPPLSHRDPGAVGAALAGEGFVEVICDTFHVSRELYPMLRACAGERLVLISDCTRAGGMADGEYTLGGQKIYVRGIECRLADGTIAGSVLKLNDAVRNYHLYAGAPLYEAVACATIHAARSVGIDDGRGALLPQMAADVLLIDENVRVRGLWKRGMRKC